MKPLVTSLAILVLAADLVLFVIFCWLIRRLRRSLVEQENTAAREALLAELGWQLTQSSDVEDIRTVGAQIAGRLCTQDPGSALLVLNVQPDRLIVDTWVTSSGVPKQLGGDGSPLPAELLAAVDAAVNPTGTELTIFTIDEAAGRALNNLDSTAMPRYWRATSVIGPWGVLLLLVGGTQPAATAVVNGFRRLITARSLAETNVAARHELEHSAVDDRSLDDRSLDDRSKEDRAADALDRGEITVEYQPMVDPRSGHCQGVEALFRWQDDGLDPMDNTEFIALAERTGQIVPIGEFVLHTACNQVSDWTIENAGWPLRLVVKISTQQLFEPDFVEMVSEALDESALAPDQLTLELLDAAWLAERWTIEVLSRLADLGVRTGIDFGEGNLQLADLQSLPIRQLRLNSALLLNEESAPTFEIGVAIGWTLQLETVADGVQTRAQAATIEAADVTLAQGSLYGEPMAAAEIVPWLRALADSLSRV